MRIYLIGDSISIQYGPFLQAYLHGIMDYSRKEGTQEALLNLDEPQGANGGDSAMVHSFLREMARNGGIDADLLLLNCGLHDIKTDPQTGKRQVSESSYAENLHKIIQIMSELKPQLLWIRTTPCDETVHNTPGKTFHRFAADVITYNKCADAIMTEAGVPILDLFSFTLNLGPDLYCDHVHFREPIRQKQAAFLAGWLMAYTQRL